MEREKAAQVAAFSCFPLREGPMDDRITDLEIHVTHLSRTVHELNDVVYRQQQTISRMEEELKLLRDQLQAAAPSMVRAPEDEEPPPHY